MLAFRPDVSAAVDEPVASSEAEGREGVAEGEEAATVFASEAEAEDWPESVPAVGCDAVRAVVDDEDDDDDAAVEARRRTALMPLRPVIAEATALRAMTDVDAAYAMAFPLFCLLLLSAMLCGRQKVKPSLPAARPNFLRSRTRGGGGGGSDHFWQTQVHKLHPLMTKVNALG